MIELEESNNDIDEALRWYNRVLDWREVDYNTGIYKRIRFEEIKMFRSVYFTYLDDEYLFEVVNSIDYEYIKNLILQKKQKAGK